MQAVIKIKNSEFNETLFRKIKAMLNKSKESSVVIKIVDGQSLYYEELTQSIAELDNGKSIVTFTPEELKKYAATRRK
jgi:hypothetical protein